MSRWETFFWLVLYGILVYGLVDMLVDHFYLPT